MINSHLAVLALLNTHPCCACCFSERIDDVADAIASGDVSVESDGDSVVGLWPTSMGLPLLRSTPLLPDATA
jgi:hypothetical protein